MSKSKNVQVPMRLTLSVDSDIFLSLVVNAHDSNAIEYWGTSLDFISAKQVEEYENNMNLFVLNFKWRIEDTEDTGQIFELDIKKMVAGTRKMLAAEMEGEYKNPYCSIFKILCDSDHLCNADASFADDWVQFCLFGEVIYG